MLVDVLPRYERYFYWISGISSIAYSVYTVHLEGEKNKEILKSAQFVPGWNFIARDKDESDYGWRIWMNLLWTLVPMSIIHVILSQALHYFKPKEDVRSCLLMIFDVSMVCYILGMRTGVFLLMVALVMYLISLLHSLSLVWLLALTLMLSMKLPSVYNFQIEYLQISNDYTARQYYISFPIFCVRLVSFGVEKIKYRKAITDTKTHEGDKENKTKLCHASDKCKQIHTGEISHQSHQRTQIQIGEVISSKNPSDFSHPHIHQETTVVSDPSFLNLLFFSFYLPTFFWGPIVLYRDFHNEIKGSFKSSVVTDNVYDIGKQLIKILLYCLFIELQFHFLYFRAISLHKSAVEGMSVWALWGLYYCQGQFFMLKYFVIYGTAIHISRFDGVAPLTMPYCVSWMYSYTDLLKYFDVGMYNLIKNYIYIPLGGSREGLIRQFIASGISFLFVFFWHGATERGLLWCAGSQLLCSLEIAATSLEKTAIGVCLTSYLSPAVRLRLKAICIYPAYLTSSLLISYFFFGMEVGSILVSKFLLEATWVAIATQYFLITCSIHNALIISQWYRYRKRNKLHDS